MKVLKQYLSVDFGYWLLLLLRQLVGKLVDLRRRLQYNSSTQTFHIKAENKQFNFSIKKNFRWLILRLVHNYQKEHCILVSLIHNPITEADSLDCKSMSKSVPKKIYYNNYCILNYLVKSYAESLRMAQSNTECSVFSDTGCPIRAGLQHVTALPKICLFP